MVKAAHTRSQALKNNVEKNNSYDNKNCAFSVLVQSLASTSAIVGNQVFQISKKDEVEIAASELNVRNRCFLVYDEEKCLKFYKANKEIILQTALAVFTNPVTSKCSNLEVNIKKRGGFKKNETKITVIKNDFKSFKECQPILSSKGKRGVLEEKENEMEKQRPTKKAYNIKGVSLKTIDTNFGNFNNKKNNDKQKNTSSIRPDKRTNLDLTKAEASHVFSSTRRINPKKSLFYAGATFWQRKYKPGSDILFRWSEVIGWDENPNSRQVSKLIKPDEPKNSKVFFLPVSFRELAEKLLVEFKPLLVCNTLVKNNKRCGGGARVKERIIRPMNDRPKDYEMLIKTFDDCLDILLPVSSNKNCSVYTNSTVNVYRRKFRRYCLYCFTLYALNAEKHSDFISPITFNFFNFFSYLYTHGKGMDSSSFLNTECFLYNHIFKPLSSASPALSAKQLKDLDYAILRGGKAAVRDFGSPVKTSLHTRSLVSYLCYAETMIASMSSLIALGQRNTKSNPFALTGIIYDRCKRSLERWCDSIIFIFFTFVLFHRFSAVKRVTLEHALRLVLGQTHLHTNKVKASKLVKFSKKILVEKEEVLNIKNLDVPDNNMERDQNDDNNDNNDGFIEAASNLTISHPHLLGLPYAIQSSMGIPVSQLNPLIASGNGITSAENFLHHNNNNNIDNNKVYKMGIEIPGVPKPPPNAQTIGQIGMFENLISTMLDKYNGEGVFNKMIEKTKDFFINNISYENTNGQLPLSIKKIHR